MSKVLVLNFDYSPLNVIPLKRGMRLIVKGKAEVISHDDNPIKTEKKDFLRPVIIRLLKYIKHTIFSYKVSRGRIYSRDNHECAYCGIKKNLTIDHVIPRSRGGGNSWENLVTCCANCNIKKGDRTPEEANMKLRIVPKKPIFMNQFAVKNYDYILKSANWLAQLYG